LLFLLLLLLIWIDKEKEILQVHESKCQLVFVKYANKINKLMKYHQALNKIESALDLQIELYDLMFSGNEVSKVNAVLLLLDKAFVVYVSKYSTHVKISAFALGAH